MGPLNNFDAFEFENLLSNVRRALLATKEPSIQGLDVLTRFVMIPVINEYFGTSSALNDLLGVVPEEKIVGTAAFGEHSWALSKKIHEQELPIDSNTIESAILQLDSTTVNCETLYFARAIRQSFEVSCAACDLPQSCCNLKSLCYAKKHKSNRVDYHICFSESQEADTCGDIVCFAMVSNKIFAVIEQFETVVHSMSEELFGTYDKFYYTTGLHPKSISIIPLSYIVHKCDMVTIKEKKTWFY